MKKIGIVLAALVIATFMVGTASAAQTSFSVVVNDGSARMQSSLTSTSNEAIPYDATQYNYNAIAVHAAGVQMIHTADFEESYLEVENSVLYFPGNSLKVMFIDEDVQRVKIAEGAENQSLCYDASAGSRVNAKTLQYESASIVTDTDMLFGVNSAGTGRIAVQTAEKLQQGDVNGSWLSSISTDSMAVRGGAFNMSAEFSSIIPESPPAAEMPANLLCPFYKP